MASLHLWGKTRPFNICKRGDLICTLALPPITCVCATSQWLFSSLSWTNERRFERSSLHFPPFLPHHLTPSPTPHRPVGEKSHSWLTAAHLFIQPQAPLPWERGGWRPVKGLAQCWYKDGVKRQRPSPGPLDHRAAASSNRDIADKETQSLKADSLQRLPV